MRAHGVRTEEGITVTSPNCTGSRLRRCGSHLNLRTTARHHSRTKARDPILLSRRKYELGIMVAEGLVEVNNRIARSISQRHFFEICSKLTDPERVTDICESLL